MPSSSLTPPTSGQAQRVNVVDRLADIAGLMPDAVAVATPVRGDMAGQNSYSTCTFEQLDQDATTLARGLVELGVQPGTKLVLLVRPGIQFVKLVFALLRSGATTVLVDPGMGRKHLINCLASVEPAGFIAISPAQALRTLLRRRFPLARTNVTVGRRWFWGGRSFKQLLQLGNNSQAPLPVTQGDDAAAIIFTSGSTGPPKGVLYTHRMFDTQSVEIQRAYAIHPGGADLACFPLFGLFNSAMGVTTVFPDMDFSRPAQADPRKLLSAARDWQVSQAFASPAVWKKLSAYCEQHGERILSLRKVLSCGAPVPAEVLRKTQLVVADGANMYTPYGATECLPVATIEADEVLQETAAQTERGAGICVGRKYDTIDWRIIRISDEPIATIEETEKLPKGEIGELIVRGPQVSPEYVAVRAVGHNEQPPHRPNPNQLAKIPDGNTTWHRLGDVGYFDSQERFWYCGRKAHRIETATETLFTIPCEAMFNTHAQVARSALVGLGPGGKQLPLLVVEPTAELLNRRRKHWGHEDYQQLKDELLSLAGKHKNTWLIQQILFHPSLPVDVRHNAKINREQLAGWAVRELGGQKLRPGSDPHNLPTTDKTLSP